MKKTNLLITIALSIYFSVMGMVTSAHAVSGWYPFRIDETKFSGIVDFSKLNKPIGRTEKTFIKEGHFYTHGFDGLSNTKDDQRIRFFGINLAGTTNFPDANRANEIAASLRSMGFNAVRLHHLDSVLSDDLENPRGILTVGRYPSFNKTAIERLRNFIVILANHGIYVNLNLHVGYQFRPAIDGLPIMNANEKMPFASHPYHMFNNKMIASQGEYAKNLLQLLRAKELNSISMVEINNESSLIGAWHRKELDKLNPVYEIELKKEWQAWLMQRYESDSKICELHQNCDAFGGWTSLVKTWEIPQESDSMTWKDRSKRLLRKVWSKLASSDPSWLQPTGANFQKGAWLRVLDFQRFLIELDGKYLNTIRTIVKNEVQAGVAITGTQMYFGGVANFDSHQTMDYLDEHFYIDHFNYPEKPWDEFNWRIKNSSILNGDLWRLVQRGWYRDFGKPFVVSEFNQAFPNDYSAQIIPIMTTVASMQDWDGLFFYHYKDGDVWDRAITSFSLAGNSAQLVNIGAFAALYRQFNVAPNKERLTYKLSKGSRLLLSAKRDEVLGGGIIAQISEEKRFNKQSIFQSQLGISPSNDEELDLVPLATTTSLEYKEKYVSLDGSIVFDSANSQFSIFHRYGWMWMGNQLSTGYVFPSGWRIKSVGADMFSVITVYSRDEQPINDSQKMLLTITTKIAGSKSGVTPEIPKELVNYRNLKDWFTLEVDSNRSSAYSGSFNVATPLWLMQRGIEMFIPCAKKDCDIVVYPLDESGQKIGILRNAIQRRDINGVWLLINYPSPWFELKRK